MRRKDWTCPVCTQPNTTDAAECINCLYPIDAKRLDIEHRKLVYGNQVGFPESSDNTPISASSLPRTKQRSLLSYLAIFMVLVPLLIVATGYAFEFLIPSCVMGGTNGAHGCHLFGIDLNPLFSFIGFGEQVYLVLGIGIFLLVVLPAWVIGASWTEFRKK